MELLVVVHYARLQVEQVLGIRFVELRGECPNQESAWPNAYIMLSLDVSMAIHFVVFCPRRVYHPAFPSEALQVSTCSEPLIQGVLAGCPDSEQRDLQILASKPPGSALVQGV